MKKIKMYLLLVVLVFAMSITSGCSDSNAGSDKSVEDDKDNNKNDKDDKDKDDGENPEIDDDVPLAWFFETSEYGKPEISVGNGEKVEVLDDNHPELKKAIEKYCVAPEDAESYMFNIYRVDDKVVSIRLSILFGDASYMFYEDYCYNFSTLGELLTLDNVSDNVIEACSADLKKEIKNYNKIVGESEFSVDDITEETPWLLDCNSIVFIERHVPFRVYYEDDESINPDIVPNGNDMFGVITKNNFEFYGTTISFVEGDYYNEDYAEPSITVSGDDYNYLEEVNLDLVKEVKGYCKYNLYIEDDKLLIYASFYNMDDGDNFNTAYLIKDDGFEMVGVIYYDKNDSPLDALDESWVSFYME